MLFPLSDLFTAPLHDLGGVLIPEPEIGQARTGITAQFLENAETYHEQYADAAHFTRLFEGAFRAGGINLQPGALILDIGSGSGANSVVPLLAMAPECRIVATDLSPDLLWMLRRYVVDRGVEDRVICVNADAMNDYFRPGQFDLVAGASILHHLIEPERAMETAYRALKPGGAAVFFEPFEGMALLRIAYDLILDRAAELRVELEGGPRLAAMSADFAIRAGSDKSAEHFRYLDDKWLFTRTWFEREARRIGFTSLAIEPHLAYPGIFRDYTLQFLKYGGFGLASLPDWAWRVIERFDMGFSPDMMRDVVVEAAVVLVKA